jgi:hypothetical protein
MAARRSTPVLKASLKAAVAAVARALAQMPAPGMLIGGISVIARGVPRTTRDVDATVSAETRQVDAVLRTFDKHELTPRIDDARAFAEANQVLLLRHEPSGVDVDVSLAWLPFELEAIDAANKLLIGEVRVRRVVAELAAALGVSVRRGARARDPARSRNDFEQRKGALLDLRSAILAIFDVANGFVGYCAERPRRSTT